jgi:hypothetical protein
MASDGLWLRIRNEGGGEEEEVVEEEEEEEEEVFLPPWLYTSSEAC